jgi:hypothetical protein
MKANNPSSSLETKSSGCPASTIGFFVERLGGENGVARSAGILPHNGSRSDVRAGGNVPRMIIDEPANKSKWSSTNKGFAITEVGSGWLMLAASLLFKFTLSGESTPKQQSSKAAKPQSSKAAKQQSRNAAQPICPGAQQRLRGQEPKPKCQIQRAGVDPAGTASRAGAI